MVFEPARRNLVGALVRELAAAADARSHAQFIEAGRQVRGAKLCDQRSRASTRDRPLRNSCGDDHNAAPSTFTLATASQNISLMTAAMTGLGQLLPDR